MKESTRKRVLPLPSDNYMEGLDANKKKGNTSPSRNLSKLGTYVRKHRQQAAVYPDYSHTDKISFTETAAVDPEGVSGD